MHFLIIWGCILSAAITFPLVFGWIHLELESELGYRAYLFGFPTQILNGRSVSAWITFHALDFTAIMVFGNLRKCCCKTYRQIREDF